MKFKLLNITVKLDLSVIAGLILFFLAFRSVALNSVSAIEENARWSGIAAYVFAAFVVISIYASVLFHEFAHSLMARRFGFSVDSIIIFILGGVSQIEGVPFYSKDKKVEWQKLLLSLAGPVSSAVLAILALAIFFVALAVNLDIVIFKFALLYFLYLFYINVMLAVFNILPIFPMDGGRIFLSLLRILGVGKKRSIIQVSAIGFVGAGLLIIFGLLNGGVMLVFVGAFLVYMNLSELKNAFKEGEE